MSFYYDITISSLLSFNEYLLTIATFSSILWGTSEITGFSAGWGSNVGANVIYFTTYYAGFSSNFGFSVAFDEKENAFFCDAIYFTSIIVCFFSTSYYCEFSFLFGSLKSLPGILLLSDIKLNGVAYQIFNF